jgi:peptidoglycan hydrolase-like protein with peptidoglycan-binding domain
MAVLLRMGSMGLEVRYVQDVLNFLLQPDVPLRLDGIFGPKTRASVVAFQQQAQLDPDGIVGPLTMKAMADATLSSLFTLDTPSVYV